jgi:uncharacterized cupin superfamily protein
MPTSERDVGNRFHRQNSILGDVANKIATMEVSALSSPVFKTIRSILGTSNGHSNAPIPWFNANDGVIAKVIANGAADSATTGNPVVRALERVASEDGGIASGVWDSTAGKHEFQFDFDEVLYFVEGEVHIAAGGEKYTFRAGDVAFVRAGVRMEWDVPNYVRKIWVHRYPRRTLIRRAWRKLRRVIAGAT